MQMSEIDEDSIFMSFDSMCLGNEQSSYSYNHPTWDSQMGSNLKVQNQDHIFNIFVYLPL